MNYYVLPKNNIQLDIKPSFISSEELTPYISQSLIYFLIKSNETLLNISNNESDNLDIINKTVNTYEFIFSNVPNSVLSVSKVKPESNIFYELLELFSICNVEEFFESNNQICSLHFSDNFHSSIYLLNIMRDNKKDLYYGVNFIVEEMDNFFNIQKDLLKCDFLYFEFKKDHYKSNKIYFMNMIKVLHIIIKNQNNDGISIIKIDNIFYKLVVDFLYILSSLFEQVFIIKPQVSNILLSERYIVCKKFISSSNLQKLQIQLEEVEKQIFHLQDNMIIQSLLQKQISYYFINKIEESNIVIGQQQLETLDQVINIIKNKNKDEKMETLKRNHIQKCIIWCEKYKIPHNKFIDKTNIFLNSKIVKDTSVKDITIINENEINENNNENEINENI